MAGESIQHINDKVASADGYFNVAPTCMGDFWISRHQLSETTRYTSRPPAGLHFGAGISSLHTTCGHQIDARCYGPVLTLLVMPEEVDAEFATTIDATEQLSCGLHMPFAQIDKQSVLANNVLPHIDPQKLSFLTVQTANELVYSLCQPATFWKDESSFRLAMNARALNLVALIVRELNNHTVTIPSHLILKLTKARQIIMQDYPQPLTIASIARKTGMSPRALSGHYKDYFGTTINDSLCRVRMQQALMLLQQGKSVSETAYLVGYSTNHFSSKFRQFFGHSPRCASLTSLPETGGNLPEIQ